MFGFQLRRQGHSFAYVESTQRYIDLQADMDRVDLAGYVVFEDVVYAKAELRRRGSR